ncbi:MAG TPA: VCBS repeat-containing protein [Planctomycetota bacterium]|nr:VCBS repeat-containing protein [Planctomycetota bacterium]
MHPTPLCCLVLGAATAPLSAQTQFVVRTPAAVAATSLIEAAAADLDGDGDLDLCAGTGLFATGPRVRLLRNAGGERFVDVTATSLPALPAGLLSTSKIVPIDIDGDGDLDLFVSANGMSLLWRNDGNLTFTDVSANLPTNFGYFNDAVVADFDGDGDFDLAASGSALGASYNQMFENQGGGVFTQSFAFPGTLSNAVVGADIDLDGDLDLVTGDASGGISVRRNDGNLVFTDVTAAWAPPGLTGVVLDVVAGDLDGDGRVDLVLGRQNIGLDLVLHNTGSAFVVAGSLAIAASGTKSMFVADVDEDGDLDLFRAAISGSITLALNDGFGSLVVSATRLPAVTSVTPRLVAGDFDGDGDVDLLACEPLSPSMLLVNRQRDLRPGQPMLGQPWHIELWSEPGYATLHHVARLGIALAVLPQPLVVPSFGELWLDLGAGYVHLDGIVLAGVGSHTFTLAVPASPPLLGLPLHVQGLAEQARGPARLTAHFGVTVQ